MGCLWVQTDRDTKCLVSSADGVRCTPADGGLFDVCECRLDVVLRGRRTRGRVVALL
ncbi:MAG: hypothetical protein IJP32_03005 [Clostridia bacterium]|nr:hypothetical protein [Clostridia bacterium]MBQ9995315.1 hypothetical protein [Clostridia bacterium]